MEIALSRRTNGNFVFRDLLLKERVFSMDDASQKELNEPLDVEFYLKSSQVNGSEEKSRGKRFAIVYTLHCNGNVIRMVLCDEGMFSRKFVNLFRLVDDGSSNSSMLACCNLKDGAFVNVLNLMEILMNGTDAILKANAGDCVDFERTLTAIADGEHIFVEDTIERNRNAGQMKGNVQTYLLHQLSWQLE